MNTDKIYAEQLANEYAPKDTSKVVALRKLDARTKLPATIFTYTFGIIAALVTAKVGHIPITCTKVGFSSIIPFLKTFPRFISKSPYRLF